MDGGKIGGEVFEISANIDDMTGEDLGAAMDILLGAGALDVWFEHIQMKKNRPAVKLSLLARLGDEERLAEAVLRHTTTLGVRMSKSSRVTLARATDTVATEFGEVRMKKWLLGGEVIKEMPEYEDVRRIAAESGEPIAAVRGMIAAAGGGKKRRFRHYKGGEYEYLGTARHSETEEELVLYRPLYNDSGLWVRPKRMFFENVVVDGKSVPRFAEIKEQMEGLRNER